MKGLWFLLKTHPFSSAAVVISWGVWMWRKLKGRRKAKRKALTIVRSGRMPNSIEPGMDIGDRGVD